MTLLYFLCMILSVSTFLKIQLKCKQEKALLMSYLSIGLFLYIFGILNILKIGFYLIIILSSMTFLYDVYAVFKKKINLKEIFTVGTIFYIGILTILYILLKDTHFLDWDEFSHWGSNLKAMVDGDYLWGNKAWDGVHVAYPPFIGIIEYFVCRLHGGYLESIAYFGINSFIITLLIPVFSNLSYKIKDILKGILYTLCVYMLIYIFQFKIASLYIDLTVALFFFIGFYISTLEKSKENTILLLLTFIILPILKDVGLIFSAIILLQIFLREIVIPFVQEKKWKKEYTKMILTLLGTVVIIFTSYFSWQVYTKLNDKKIDYQHDSNNIESLDLKEYVKGVSLVFASDGKYKDIATSFYSFLNNNDIIGRYPCRTIIQIFVVLNLIGIFLYYLFKHDKEKKKIISSFISLDIGFVIYSLFILLIFMFGFLEHEGRALASFPRYISTYFIAWVVFIVTLLLESKDKKSTMWLFVATLICLYGSDIHTLMTPIRRHTTAYSTNITDMTDQIKETVKQDEKVYIILQNTNGYEFHLMRYELSPMKTNLLYEWSMGEKYGDADLWSYDLSLEAFEQKLIDEKFDYLYLGIVDEQFINLYQTLFEEPIHADDDQTLYKIKKENNHVTFMKVK